MNALIDLILNNPIAPLFIIMAVIFLVKKDDWLAQAKKHHQNPAIVKYMMVVVVLLAGVCMIVTGGMRLRLEQNRHRGELRVKETEIRLLNDEIEHLKSK